MLTKKICRKSSAGFSLIEVLVAAAVMGMLGLVFSQMLVTNLKGQRGVQDSSDINTFGTSLQMILAVGGICKANLGSIKFDTSKDSSVLQPSLSGIYYTKYDQANQTYIQDKTNPLITTPAAGLATSTYGRWEVPAKLGMGIRNQTPATGAPPAKDAPGIWLISVEVNFDKKRDAQGATLSFGATSARKQATVLAVTTKATGNGQEVEIQDCCLSGACTTLAGGADCPPNETMVGITATGAPKCAPYPKISQACTPGSFISSIQNNVLTCEAPVVAAAPPVNNYYQAPSPAAPTQTVVVAQPAPEQKTIKMFQYTTCEFKVKKLNEHGSCTPPACPKEYPTSEGCSVTSPDGGLIGGSFGAVGVGNYCVKIGYNIAGKVNASPATFLCKRTCSGLVGP